MKLINTLLKTTLLLFVITFSSCKDDSTNPSNTNNNNSSSGSIQYFFDIEIGGIKHKIEGNSEDIDYLNILASNKCYQTKSGGDWSFQFSIDDRSVPQYITGENIALSLTTENTKLGENVGSINFSNINSYFKSFFESKNISSALPRFVEGKAIDMPDASEVNKVSNIQLTDLGTPTYAPQVGGPCPFDPNNTGAYCWGETVKGSYSGTLYFMSKDDYNNFNIPIDVSIKFAALRMPY